MSVKSIHSSIPQSSNTPAIFHNYSNCANMKVLSLVMAVVFATLAAAVPVDESSGNKLVS
jgi:hypothetical protein